MESVEHSEGLTRPATLWWRDRVVAVTGGTGFLGSHLVKRLSSCRPGAVHALSSRDYDLRRQTEVARMYEELRPDVVIHLAARVGGIGANRENPGRFFYENAIMGIEILEQARLHGVHKIVIVGTVCAYPGNTAVPFSENDLWEGYPEPTNAPYGIAKKVLLVQAQAYRQQYGLDAIYLLPVNLYGPGDNFDPASSHVIPALIRKFLEARAAGSDRVVLWGTGSATREFLHVDDAARAILLAAERYGKPAPVNLGTSHEISIRDLAALVQRLTGFGGTIVWDHAHPDGQPRRKLNTDRARVEFGFTATTDFEAGLRDTIQQYERHG